LDPRHPADVPRRPGKRLRYLSTAVQPLRDQLGAAATERLTAALGLCVGIESIIVTRDICNLSDAKAEEVKRWTAQALLRQALLDAAPKPEAVQKPPPPAPSQRDRMRKRNTRG
jgi:hypothetical protein